MINKHKECIDDLILEVDADLSVYFFVDAMRLLDWHRNVILKDSNPSYHFREIVVNLANYHTAQQLSNVADIGVMIDNNLDKDEWILYDYWSHGFKRVYSSGA